MTDTDPRLQTNYVRTLPGGDAGDVTLVGVVHDHPASVYRVRTVVGERDPDVLGLELPPLAVPLYEAHAADERSMAAFGGEMSAAIDAASTDDVVGIDGPTAGFVRHLAATLVRERASARAVCRTVRELGSVVRTTALCRVAGAVTANTSLWVGVDAGATHGTTEADPPAEQAGDERRQIRNANAVLDAIERPAASRCRSAAREHYMADRLGSLRERGDVVAVVGVGHFDAVRERLDASGPDEA